MFGATKKCEHCGCSFGMFDSDIWAYRRKKRMCTSVRSVRNGWRGHVRGCVGTVPRDERAKKNNARRNRINVVRCSFNKIKKEGPENLYIV